MPSSGPAERPDAQIGYTRVDAHPDAALLIKGMEQTAQWPAVRQLRAWERTQLALQPGERLADVGCGLGDVAIALAADVGPVGLGDRHRCQRGHARRRASAFGRGRGRRRRRPRRAR